MKRLVHIERHRLGPRVRVLGCRIHEFQVGLAVIAVRAPNRWSALLGLALVVKDWHDVFPATRDRASWRWGIHRVSRGA